MTTQKRYVLTSIFSITLSLSTPSVKLWASGATAMGPSTLEASMTFTASVVLPEGTRSTQKNIEGVINDQTKHLLSEFESANYAKYLGAKVNGDLGIIGLGAIENVQILDKKKNAEGLTVVTYKAREKVLVHNKFLAAKERKEIDFFMPRDPSRFYVPERVSPADVAETPQALQKNLFYYYWQPPYKAEDQKFFTGVNQVDNVKAVLYGLTPPNQNATPDIARLRKRVEEKGELSIALLVGFDKKSTDPNDNGRKSYEDFKAWFLKNGFEHDSGRNTPTGPYVNLVREAHGNSPRIRVSLSLSASDNYRPMTFAKRAAEAFATADIIYYDGHSGLGANLDFHRLSESHEGESIKGDKGSAPVKFSDGYQILFIDSCASYYFYSQMYSMAKKGPHNIDVVSNGLTSDFDAQNPETLAVLTPFFDLYKPDEKKLTWMKLLTESELRHKRCSFLLNVRNIPPRRGK